MTEREWQVVVKAPEGGPNYVHHFWGTDPSAILREIAEALDLSTADAVTVCMLPLAAAPLNQKQPSAKLPEGG